MAQDSTEQQQYTWQPVMLIAPERVECDCGAKAIFIVLDDFATSGDEKEYGIVAWCRDCFERAQEAEE